MAALVFSVPVVAAALLFMPDYEFLREYFIPDSRPFREKLAGYREGMSVWVRVMTGLFTFVTLIGAAVRGAGAVVGEKDRDTWVTLSSLPITPWELARGKWLGAALAPRRIYALLLTVWAFGLALGCVDFPMIVLTAVYLAACAAAFAWLGVCCSLNAKSTLTATIRALFAALFLLGGFWGRRTDRMCAADRAIAIE